MDEVIYLQEEVQVLRQENAYLKEELAQLKRMIFGSKRERFIAPDPTQQSLFDTEVAQAAAEQETITYQRDKPQKKGKAKRLPIPAHLPRQEQVLEPEGIDKQSCVQIREKISEVLEYTPGKLYVIKTIRPIYKQADGNMVIADLPTQVIPNGNAGARSVQSDQRN